MNLSANGRTVLEKRYLRPNENPEQLFSRVANNIASVEKHSNREFYAEQFYNLMATFDFLPNSPTLMNAGSELQQLSACFVLPVHDSIESIFETIKNTALVHKSGGGTGFNFSQIRPKNSKVKSTRGIASGPVTFIKVFDAATEAIKQGGTRRGANMAILDIDHPDIHDFIRSKLDGTLTNFNISVAVTSNFMEKVLKNSQKELELFYLIAQCAHQTGDPGLIFIDEINRKHWNPHLGRINSTNPCGEQPLLPFEACTLGSINLNNFLKPNKELDWDRFDDVIKLSIRFLDNTLDASKYPLSEIALQVLKTRRIGLGVMGFADLLTKLNLDYDSEEARNLACDIADYLATASEEYSRELAEEKSCYPALLGSDLFDMFSPFGIRNTQPTTIAPTGTISMIADCSSGIEPHFANTFTKTVLDGTKFNYKAKGKTAHEISYKDHILMQAAWQTYIHNGVSKTINMPNSATVEDVLEAYKLAYTTKCFGITVFRDGCKVGVLSTNCPQSGCPGQLIPQEGCFNCNQCSYGYCT